MISDFVKGKSRFRYPIEIQQGIELHRAIDHFTDRHDANREAKSVFRPRYRLYSGAMVDVVYDHFLATDETVFSNESLYNFSISVFTTMDKQSAWFPNRFAGMYAYMKQQNWLFNYHSRWGIQKSIAGLVRRALYMSDSQTAFSLFETNYQLLKTCYRHFWGEAEAFAKNIFDGFL